MNRADQRKYHVIYKTTCSITGKWYIGMHSTDELNDGYMGSGQLLWKSIKKYGRDSHKCVILEHLPSRKALVLREEEIITKDILHDPLCMNLRSGGTGNYPGTPTDDTTRQKLSSVLKAHYTSEAGRKTIAARRSDHYVSGDRHGMYGKTHSPEIRASIGASNRKPKPPFSDEHRRKISENMKRINAERRLNKTKAHHDIA